MLEEYTHLERKKSPIINEENVNDIPEWEKLPFKQSKEYDKQAIHLGKGIEKGKKIFSKNIFACSYFYYSICFLLDQNIDNDDLKQMYPQYDIQIRQHLSK